MPDEDDPADLERYWRRLRGPRRPETQEAHNRLGHVTTELPQELLADLQNLLQVQTTSRLYSATDLARIGAPWPHSMRAQLAHGPATPVGMLAYTTVLPTGRSNSQVRLQYTFPGVPIAGAILGVLITEVPFPTFFVSVPSPIYAWVGDLVSVDVTFDLPSVLMANFREQNIRMV